MSPQEIFDAIFLGLFAGGVGTLVYVLWRLGKT